MVWFSKCLQHSVSVSLETVIQNQVVSRNQFLIGNVFAIRFLEMAHVTIYSQLPSISGRNLLYLQPASAPCSGDKGPT
jgi:hypothetical protein